MKGGHTDNYYFQMIANLRRYKGVRAPQAITNPAIAVDGSFSDWASVAPEYDDYSGDAFNRTSTLVGTPSTLVNTTAATTLPR